MTPWQMLLFAIAGWLNQYQQIKLEFALEQFRVYKEPSMSSTTTLNVRIRDRAIN